MVLIEFKRSEKNSMLVEMQSGSDITSVLKVLVKINNLKVSIDKLCKGIEGLAENGPMRPDALRGLTQPETYKQALENLSKDELAFINTSPLPYQEICPDSSGYRTGLGLNKDYKERLLEQVKKAKDFISNDQLSRKFLFTIENLENELNLLRGAIMIAFPGYHGIPTWEPVYLILEGKFDFLLCYPDCDWLDEDKTVLWWAKKELLANKTLKDYCGSNEKTKIIVKAMGKGKGTPISESPIDQETQKKMMSFYYKKQEENKKLDQENDDDYLNSAWADSTNLKKQLINGGNNIRIGSFK